MQTILFNSHKNQLYKKLKLCLPVSVKLVQDADRNHYNLYKELYSPDVLILHLEQQNADIKDFNYLKRLLACPDIPEVILISTYITKTQLTTAMKMGVYDCLFGCLSGKTLASVIMQILNDKKLTVPENRFMVGQSKALSIIWDKIQKYANYEEPVLITGETGTGKDLVANALHYCGPRKEQPYVAINCSSYTDELFASELFGVVNGAFTDSKNRIGLFEVAQNGTLFLDEIGDLSNLGQVKLLRAVEEKAIRRIGSTELKNMNVRILAATNKDPQQLKNSTSFRKDLYYRLSAMEISIPPLRERKADIPVISRTIINKHSKTPCQIDSLAMEKLLGYDWPGNVRELQSVLLKAVIDSENRIVRAKNLSI